MKTIDIPPTTLSSSRADQYVRMSTEHQQYSPENQLEIIRQYAASHSMEIVKVYSDHGRSGLNILGREGLNQLLSSTIGRTSLRCWFTTSAAGVGFRMSTRAPITSMSSSEPGSGFTTALNSSRTIKRSMAAEYSLELSVKVFAGQCRLIELGFRQGGPAGYGLRRQLIDRNRHAKGLLGRGERKSLQTDRVILVPGLKQEVEVVRYIYESFVEGQKVEREIAEDLNSKGIDGEYSRPWTRSTVHQVLTNPKYIGANIYNRRSFKLKHTRVQNPAQMWIWKEDAFESTVEEGVFRRARTMIELRHQHLR